MEVLFFLLVGSWFVRTIKSALFWLYVWQLKEYHIGRFLDYAKSIQGKQAISQKLLFVKLFFLAYEVVLAYIFISRPDIVFTIGVGMWILFFSVFGAMVFVYVVEAVRAVQQYYRKTLLSPVFTKKVVILFSMLSLFVVG
ncbi:MAG: hypothetical protein QF775_03920, partial [archaeon]|nr:hypothetical protein [archaeon]